MTDVWNFPRVTGDERHGHATPKPVDMIARCIKSSCPADGLTLEPFCGSGTTLIACEQLHRRCYAMEISPGYVAVSLQRWATATGGTPCLT
jgi:DNA modification methylase